MSLTRIIRRDVSCLNALVWKARTSLEEGLALAHRDFLAAGRR